jgi:predicted dehydrogenase
LTESLASLLRNGPKDNLVHYNWHWHCTGGGELANNGVHALDVARWGLGVDLPRRITFNGGRYHFADDQETPDTGVATYDYGNKGIAWDDSSCLPRKQEAHPFVSFYGDSGILTISGGASYKVYDLNGKETSSATNRFSDVPHFANFVDAIRNGTKLNSTSPTRKRARCSVTWEISRGARAYAGR